MYRLHQSFCDVFYLKLLTYAKLTDIKYGDQSTTTIPSSYFVYVWNVFTNPTMLVSQTIAVDNAYVIVASYDKNKNRTIVFTKKEGTVIKKQIFTGLHIIKLITNNGIIGYEL